MDLRQKLKDITAQQALLLEQVLANMGDDILNAQLKAMMEEKQPSVFYSSDLCARYFTCLQEKESHFILFDDSGTITRKIQAGNALGIPTGFLLYPETEDLLPQLFSRQGSGSLQRS